MSFISRNGTRGSRQPRGGPFTRWITRQVVKRIKTRGGRFMGMNTLVLSTVGKKSGVERETPVGWFPGVDDSWIIVASAAAAPRNPAWYYNLAANPDKATITVEGKSIPVIAIQLHGEERSEAWRKIIALAPRFAQYETKTDRIIPIIRLTRRGS